MPLGADIPSIRLRCLLTVRVEPRPGFVSSLYLVLLVNC